MSSTKLKFIDLLIFKMETTTKIPEGINSAHANAHLNTAVPCFFPHLDTQNNTEKKPFSHELDIKQSKELKAFLGTNYAEAPFLLHTLWALVLRCYTAQDDVCFAYEEMLDFDQVVGLPFVRLVLDEAGSLAQTIKQAQNDYMEALQSNVLHPPVENLCNSLLSITRSSDNSSQDPAPCHEQVRFAIT